MTMQKTSPTLSWVQRHRDQILEIASKYGVGNVRIFGSVARDEATIASDIDFLVNFPPKFTLVKWGSLLSELEELLDYPVQIVNESNLREELREVVMEDVRVL
jgi:hypothetical protein